MFADRGYDQVTTHQIAARARVSVGALYRYFRNKQAVLHEVYVREVSGLRDRILSGFSAVELVGADPRQVVRKALGLVFRVSAERPGLRRVLAEQSRKIPQLAALRRLADAEVQASARAVLESFPGIRALDVAAAAYFVQLFVEALAEDYILYRPGGQPLGEERVLDAATDLVLRYVLASAK
jgi:AcrR family transcriptional regulator